MQINFSHNLRLRKNLRIENMNMMTFTMNAETESNHTLEVTF